MGLLLSVLVTCLGVVELLTFYSNVKKRVNRQPVQAALSTFHDQYLKELEGVRDRLENQLQQLQKQQSTITPTLRLNSHEDIDIEFNEKAIAKSRSPSPRRFLVSEKKNSNSGAATRHFTVTEEPQALQGIKKSKAQECLPEYLIEEQESKEAGVSRYSLKSAVEPIALPLPEKFFISEREPDVFRRKLGHNVVEVDGEEYYRRSPSPFPTYDLTAPRNSVCSELLDDAAVLEVDESSRSNSHSPVNSEINNNAAEKVGANVELFPKNKDASASNDADVDDDEEFMEVETFTEEMKNSLDGVDRTKGCIKKKYVKRKRNATKLGSESARTTAEENPLKSNNVTESVAGAKPGEPFWVNR